MKLTNPETIQESEKEFIDAINAELDWDSIEKLLLEKHKFAIQDEVDYKEENLVEDNYSLPDYSSNRFIPPPVPEEGPVMTPFHFSTVLYWEHVDSFGPNIA